MKTTLRVIAALLLSYASICFAQTTQIMTSTSPQVIASLKYQGAYVGGTVYSLNDVASSAGIFYVSQAAGNVGNVLTNTAFWLPLGSSAAGSPGLVTAWTASTAYATGQLASYSGVAYYATTAFTSGGSFVGANWTQLTGATGPSGPAPSGTGLAGVTGGVAQLATGHLASLPTNCVATSGSRTAYVCVTSPVFTAVAGDHIQFMADVSNTGAATLSVNGQAAGAIQKQGGIAAIILGDLQASHWISATYTGTAWQLEGQLGNGYDALGAAAAAVASLTPKTISTQAGATYTVQPSDCTQLGTIVLFTNPGATAVTLPVTGFNTGCQLSVKSATLGGSVTLTATSGTVDGLASNLFFFPGDKILTWTGSTWIGQNSTLHGASTLLPANVGNLISETAAGNVGPLTPSAAAGTIDLAIKSQTGCTTAGYVWTPASNTCSAQTAGSGGPPTGSASGDLSGSYPSPLVLNYNGTPVYNALSNSFLMTTTPPALTANTYINTIFGVQAGGNIASGASPSNGGQGNVFMGYQAGKSATSERESVLIGQAAGAGITGNGSGPDDMIFDCIGSLACASLTNLGGAGVMVGQKSGLNDLSSYADVFVGVHSATEYNNTKYNVIIGQSAGNGSTTPATTSTADNNVAIGYNIMAGDAGGTKTENVFIGSNAVIALGASVQNTFIGARVCQNCVAPGSNNTVIGDAAVGGNLGGPLTGQYNTVLGSGAALHLSSGSSNIVIGTSGNLQTGSNNTVIGGNSGNGLVAGSGNAFIGQGAGGNSDSSNNVAIGPGAGAASGTGNSTTVGYRAGQSMTGSRNTAIGDYALKNVAAGTDNTAIGDLACTSLTGTDSGNSCLGSNAQVAAGISNSTEIGPGTNYAANSLAYYGYQIADQTGDLFGKKFVNAVGTLGQSGGMYGTIALQTITLTQNVALSYNGGTNTGQTITFDICQPATGGPYTWTWPSAFRGGMVIGTAANTCSVQTFVTVNGSTFLATSTGASGMAP